MKRICLFLLAVTAIAGAQPLQAGLPGFDSGCCKPAGCGDAAACQPCVLVCHPEIKTETVKNYCWEVECDYVCVPQVQCPVGKWFRKKLRGESCCGTCGAGECQNCGSCGTATCGTTACQTCTTCGIGGCENDDFCGTSGCNVCDSCEQPPLRARIRRVRKLKKVEYECEKCVVEWHIQQCATCFGPQDGKAACTMQPPTACTPTQQ